MSDDTETRQAPPPTELLRPDSKGALSRSAPVALRGALKKLVSSLRGVDEYGAPRLQFRFPSYFVTFVAMVVVPSFLAILYLAFLASDQYVAEARFAVRNLALEEPSKPSSSAKVEISGTQGAASSGPLGTLAGQDAYVVANYIRSHAVFADLPKDLSLEEIFRRQEADFWARLKASPTREELTRYWRDMVTTYVDGPSGIVTVSVRAFRAKDAYDVNIALIAASEKLVNSLSVRARQDTMGRAEQEVRRAEGMVRDALVELQGYRDSAGIISPGDAGNSISQLLLQAMADKIRLQNDYFVTTHTLSSNAPTAQTLKSRLDAVDQQITALKKQLTGGDGDKSDKQTISASLVRFEELELKRIFAEKRMTMAQDSLERARMHAARQEIYLTVFAPPFLAQEARYPERLNLSVIIPVILLILWASWRSSPLPSKITRCRAAMTHFTSHNLSAIGHVEMLKAQWRVLVALMLRDLRSRHGSVLGFAVPILYPLGHILLLLIWSSLAHRAVPYGDSGALWYATGIVPFMSFSYMSRFTMMGVVQNKSLLSFAVVKINDIVFSRAIVEILRSTIVIIILVLLFWYYDIDFVPLQISQFFFALFASLFLGLGFGVLNAIIATLAPAPKC
jgi:capsular polysaccharide transport system permease protein